MAQHNPGCWRGLNRSVSSWLRAIWLGCWVKPWLHGRNVGRGRWPDAGCRAAQRRVHHRIRRSGRPATTRLPGGHFGMLRAQLVVGAVSLLALLTLPAARPLSPSTRSTWPQLPLPLSRAPDSPKGDQGAAPHLPHDAADQGQEMLKRPSGRTFAAIGAVGSTPLAWLSRKDPLSDVG